MKAISRTVNGVEIIALEGKITIGAGDTQLREVITNAVNSGKTNILLDLSKVTTIDSSGIGELVGPLGVGERLLGHVQQLRERRSVAEEIHFQAQRGVARARTRRSDRRHDGETRGGGEHFLLARRDRDQARKQLQSRNFGSDVHRDGLRFGIPGRHRNDFSDGDRLRALIGDLVRDGNGRTGTNLFAANLGIDAHGALRSDDAARRIHVHGRGGAGDEKESKCRRPTVHAVLLVSRGNLATALEYCSVPPGPRRRAASLGRVDHRRRIARRPDHRQRVQEDRVAALQPAVEEIVGETLHRARSRLRLE